MKNKKILPCLLTLALMTGSLSACGKDEGATMDTSIHVESQTAATGTLSIYSDYIGTAAPSDSVTVTPLVSGTVESVNVKVGDSVKAGDVLCQFDDTAAQLSLDSANNAVESAKAGKDASKASTDASNAQTEGSLTTLQDTLDAYEESKADAQMQLDTLNDQLADAESATETAQTAATESQTLYKTAEALYINFRSFLDTYPDCQTTAGLSLAAAGTDLTDPKVTQATALLSSLSEAGLTVEYLSDSGLNTLKENATAAETAATQAATAYQTLQSSISTLEQSITQLDTQIKATEDSLANAKKLKSISDSADTDAVYDAQIKSAQTGVDSAQYQVDLYTITAPVDGVIESCSVKENEMFATGYPAFIIAGGSSAVITFYVTEEVRNFIRVGDSVTVTNKDTDYTGQVTTIAEKADDVKALFAIEAEVPLSDGASIANGVSVSLRLITDEESGHIVIPYDAVYYEDNQAFVYIIKNDTATRVDVETGLYSDEEICILSGLNEGDEVITTWASGLKDGAAIAR